ncbi:Uncharacterised protein [Mycobacteroides abscessus subsp. abscessus]|nr:Uncharacterised protein [Mycobacteroides abscessus subsp. abscessus]
MRTTFMCGPHMSSNRPFSAAAACARAARCGAGRPSWLNSTPTISPRPRTSPSIPLSAAIFRAPSRSSWPRARALSTRPSSSITSRVASAAAHATALAP